MVTEQAAVEEWAEGLSALHGRIASRFARAEARQRALRYLRGLLSPIERKNGWQLAEQAGETTPDGMQRLLAAAKWDADAVRNDLRAYVVEQLADADAVLVVDETGFIKKGTKSVGVQKQYSGTAGRIENCQIGVFLAYASPKGRAFIDRELYLPKSWAEDKPRRKEAGVPEEVTYQSKAELTLKMLGRAFEAGVEVPWVVADALYGSDSAVRRFLEAREQSYVLALRSNVYLWDLGGEQGLRQITVAERVSRLGEGEWKRLSAGDGAKGPRLYDWALIPIKRLLPDGFGFWLLARRKLGDPTEIAYYYVFGPKATSLANMVRVVGMRWMVEEVLELAKDEVGLDEYEVRRWDSWYRHVTLALLAQAYLSVVRVQAVQIQATETESTAKGAA